MFSQSKLFSLVFLVVLNSVFRQSSVIAVGETQTQTQSETTMTTTLRRAESESDSESGNSNYHHHNHAHHRNTRHNDNGPADTDAVTVTDSDGPEPSEDVKHKSMSVSYSGNIEPDSEDSIANSDSNGKAVNIHKVNHLKSESEANLNQNQNAISDIKIKNKSVNSNSGSESLVEVAQDTENSLVTSLNKITQRINPYRISFTSSSLNPLSYFQQSESFKLSSESRSTSGHPKCSEIKKNGAGPVSDKKTCAEYCQTAEGFANGDYDDGEKSCKCLKKSGGKEYETVCGAMNGRNMSMVMWGIVVILGIYGNVNGGDFMTWGLM